jgi:hypothetical protein
VNNFEIAILRMLVKTQKPVSIPYLVQGFPNNSEDFVLWAVGNLFKSGFILYPDNEKRNCIIYNRQKRKEILKIIDPLPALEAETGQSFSIHKQQAKPQLQPLLTTNRKAGSNNNNNNKRLYSLHRQSYAKIALAISILSIGSVIILGSTTPTSSVYRHFGLFGAYYHYSHSPYYNVGVYYDQFASYNVYSPKFLNTDETPAGSSVPLYLAHKSAENCNV